MTRNKDYAQGVEDGYKKEINLELRLLAASACLAGKPVAFNLQLTELISIEDNPGLHSMKCTFKLKSNRKSTQRKKK